MLDRLLGLLAPASDLDERLDRVAEKLVDAELEEARKAREAAKRNGLVLPNGDADGGGR